jgi:adenosylcobinamide-phosphate synthase
LILPFPIEGLALVVLIAYLLDLLIGDPRWLPHPVRWMGLLISALEKILRRPSSSHLFLRFTGLLLSIIVVVSVYALSALALYCAAKVSTPLFYLFAVIMLWSTLSVRGLHKAAISVSGALKDGGVKEARRELSYIVGRDTGKLTPAEIERALVETVSENTSDGIVAPLFFMAIGGPPLALAYKAVNTLDSMLGYKNEKYISFGWFPARLDDLANYLPARITAVIMVAASFVLGFDWRSSARILMRDGSAHPSPNAGRPEAAVAGALGMTLGGASVYNDKVVVKPVIGEGLAGSIPKAVASTVKIMHLTGIVMAGLAATIIYFQ